MTTKAVAVETPAGMPAPTLSQLFIHFLMISLLAFGGVLPWARRRLVEERRWLTEREFLDTLALCQFLPGPNIVNMSIAVGARYRGLPGSCAAFAGILGLPCVIVVLLGVLYTRYGGITEVQGALFGVSAAASGMILAMVVKIGLPVLKRRPYEAAPIILIVFAVVAVLRIPLWWVMLVAGPISIAISWWRRA